MSSNTSEPQIVRVSQKGQATIPKMLRDKFNIETPGNVVVYESSRGIIIEPVPTLDDLHGVFADESPDGDMLEQVRHDRAAEKRQEDDREESFRPSSHE